MSKIKYKRVLLKLSGAALAGDQKAGISSEIIGNIKFDSLDKIIISKFKEIAPVIPECNDCPHYPDCINLKNCPNTQINFPQCQLYKQVEVERKIKNQFEKYITNID